MLNGGLVLVMEDVLPSKFRRAFNQINTADSPLLPTASLTAKLDSVQPLYPGVKKTVVAWASKVGAGMIERFRNLCVCQLHATLEIDRDETDIRILPGVITSFWIHSNKPNLGFADVSEVGDRNRLVGARPHEGLDAVFQFGPRAVHTLVEFGV